MDILVFVKQVPDDSMEIHLDGAGVPAVKDVEKVTNAFDTYALELATRYTEANGGEVTVAAIGTEDSVTGAVCCIACIPVGRSARALPSKYWTTWIVMRLGLSQ